MKIWDIINGLFLAFLVYAHLDTWKQARQTNQWIQAVHKAVVEK